MPTVWGLRVVSRTAIHQAMLVSWQALGEQKALGEHAA